MHSITTINHFIDYAKAFLAEIDPSDPPQCRKSRALQAKRMLENAKLRIDKLLTASPGLTDSSEDIKEALMRYRLFNGQAMSIILSLSSLKGGEMLLSELSGAEIAMARALDRLASPQEAINALNRVEMVKNALEREGQRIPDTIIQRLEGLRGYRTYL